MNRYQVTIAKLIVCVVCSALLVGCKTYVPLSERAVVKAIYLNESKQGVQASLVVYTCKASANTADVTGTPRIYQGHGDSIEKALTDAEEQQNKKPFYAQNRLLLLGVGTFDHISEYLSYFGAEEVSRANLSVFLTHTQQDEFSKLEESIATVVEEGERLTLESKEGGNKTQAIHELRYDEENQFYGYLPILELGENDFVGIKELLLYNCGVPLCSLKEVTMQLALFFSGKTNTLTVRLPGESQDTTVNTQRLFIQRETTQDGTLVIQIVGKIESITQNGRTLQAQEQSHALALCNKLLGYDAQQLLTLTTQRDSDVFSNNWWMQNEQNKDCEKIVVESKLRIA